MDPYCNLYDDTIYLLSKDTLSYENGLSRKLQGGTGIILQYIQYIVWCRPRCSPKKCSPPNAPRKMLSKKCSPKQNAPRKKCSPSKCSPSKCSPKKNAPRKKMLPPKKCSPSKCSLKNALQSYSCQQI